MDSPLCLIENDNGVLQAVPEAINYLMRIHQRVVIVAVVGLYRTGKSYLMNKLAGRRDGFALGASVQSKTKGIWMWCVPHPDKADHTLVLLDTEGLGDVEKGDSKNDAWIFSLAVLLSSTLVYNSRGTIDNHAVENLQYVSELTDRIQVKSSSEEEDGEDGQFVQFFPNFVWAVRDFTLHLNIDGRDVTADEYLEHSLELKKGRDKRTLLYNLPRECVRSYFPTRKCFVFPTPASPADMPRLESMDESELCQGFRNAADAFCRYVFKMSRVKTVKGGQCVTGRMLGQLVKTYVETIAKGGVPCLENAVLAMAQAEEVLKLFLKEKSVESSNILQTDKKLTDNERKIHEEIERAAIAEQEMKVEQEKRQLLERQMQDMERSQQESMCQMKAKIEQEAEQRKHEMERALESKLEEQRRLHAKDFAEKEATMKEEINSLKQKMDEAKQEKKEENTFLPELAMTVIQGVSEGFGHYFNYRQAREKRKALTIQKTTSTPRMKSGVAHVPNSKRKSPDLDQVKRFQKS